MSTDAELRPPPPADEAGEARSFLADIWATISTDEFAGRVLVTATVTLAVGWLGIKEAVGAVIASQVLTEAVKNFIRRRRLSRKKIWLITLLILLFQLAQRAWAAVARAFRLKRRDERRTSPPGRRAAAIMSVAVSGFTVAAISAPELALGHQLVGHRHTTFFATRAPNGDSAPKLTLPHPGEVEATGPDGARITYSASATPGEVHCSRASGSIFPIGTTMVTCAVSGPGPRLSGMFTVRVADREAPTLQLPSGIKRKILGDAATLPFVATARDQVDGGVPVSCSPRSGATYKLGRTTVHCSAVDAHGNRASRSFVVDLRHPPPGTPVFALPSNPIVEATGPSGAVVTYTASAKDASARPLNVACSPRSGSVFAIGRRSVTCSATVPGGHGQQQTFDVTVHDTTRPILHVPDSFSVEADSKDGAVVTYTVSASDTVSGTVAVDCLPVSGARLSIGSHPVTCTAKDGARNIARRSFNASVFDGTPSITVPADIKQPYTKPPGAIVRYTASATDRIDGTLVPNCVPRSGSFFRVGATRVTCSVTDSGGNHLTKSFDITIVDAVPPVLKLPDITVTAGYGDTTFVVTFTAVARDAIDGSIPASCSPPSGSTFPVGKTTRVSCNATDRSGNTVHANFDVKVNPGIG